MLYAVSQHTKFILKILNGFPVTRVTVTIYIRTYGLRLTDFHENRKCSTALCADIVCRIHVQSRDRVLLIPRNKYVFQCADFHEIQEQSEHYAET